ncbi:MAG: hypothetical protein IJX06_01150 [Clostridia bacterium]|nr:hypothetical protein [Clostridia bacterium]
MSQNNNYYAACPICGHKVCKAEEGTAVEILCHKCGQLVRVLVKDHVIQTKIIVKENSKK